MTTPAAASPLRSDEQLLGAYADVDRSRDEREAAFRELADRYRRRVFAVCYRVLGSAVDAEDATQETMVKLARGAGSFRGEAKLSTWLYRVARNVCTDHVRYDARRPATPVDDLTMVGDQPVDDVSEAHATANAVTQALEQLDERSRQLLLLVAVDELSYAEAAEATGLAVGTVKSRVSRARVRLGELLGRDDEAASARGLARPDPVADPDGGVSPHAPRGPPDD